MVLPTHIGPVKASFAVDTGAAVNVLSEKSYLALKRAARGGRYPLRPTDRNLMGVSSAPLNILGNVRLPVKLGKNTSTIQLDFYVVSNFSLPADGLLGLESMSANQMVIYPDIGTIKYQGKNFRAMGQPRRLVSSSIDDKGKPVLSTDYTTDVVPSICALPRRHPERTQIKPKEKPTGSGSYQTVVSNKGESKEVDLGKWKIVKATVVGNHEIPSRTAVHLPVSVPNATVGCDICLEGPSKLNRLAVEPTLNTVREGNQTIALVVNSTNCPVKLKQGVLLTQALVYDRQVVSEPMDLPDTCVASVQSSKQDSETTHAPTLDSLVVVKDYPELRHSLIELLSKYRDVIALPGEPLGATNMTEHHIKLKPDTRPVYIPAYRLPHSQREEVNKRVEEMLQQGVIQHSKSPWNSPLFLVPKKDGTYRPVIDFRQVNKVTEDDRYPLPVLKDILMSLGHGNRFFSSLDLLNGYWQVPMAPKSREITAFSTPRGHFEWLRMPFGLKSSPITFQRFVNTLFADMIGKNVYAYLDDLILFDRDAESHFSSLKLVLTKLREAGLKAKLSKCDFLRTSITFLGHLVDADGIHALDDKIKAVKNFPRPQNVDNVRSFLGLCGYYRSFVKGFASIASPLTKLLKKDVLFHWNAAQEQSFQTLKFALTNAPILAFPDYTAPFLLYTDASALGLGAVLMQTDENGKNRAIAYASRTLNSAESNYSVTHQETLAIIWALKTFKDIILGYPITCYTDHSAVTELFKGRNLTGRLARWYLTIQEFNPTFKYLPGRANKVADALSRNVHVGAINQENKKLPNFSVHELACAQREHDVWSKVIHYLQSGDEVSLPKLHTPLNQFLLNRDGVLCRYWPNKRHPVTQFVIPEVYVPTVLRMVHDTAVAGHPGKERTLAAARVKYYWPTMRLDIDAYVDQCAKCAQHKGTVPKPAPILEYPPPTRQWDVVGIDLLQLPTSRQGSKYLLVCVDHFSRYVVLAPLKDKTASAIAHALICKLFNVYQTPRVLLSDNGAEFRNALLHEICSQYNIAQTFITTYHPASNGLVERANRKILDVLRPVVGGLLESWEDWLSHVAVSINSSLCESVGQSPHYIIFGEEIRFPYDVLNSPQPPVYNVEDYGKCQLKVFSDIHREVRKRLQESKTAMSLQQHKRSSPVELQTGDTVMVKVPERRSKLSPKFVGPRLITKQLHGNKFEVFDPWLNTLQVIHSDRLKKTKAQSKMDQVGTANLDDAVRLDSEPSRDTSTKTTNQHRYNLRPRN